MLFRTHYSPCSKIESPTLGIVAVLQTSPNKPVVGYGKYTLYLTGQSVFPPVELSRPTDPRVAKYTQIAANAKKPGPIPWPAAAFGPFPFRRATMRSLYNAAKTPVQRNRLIRSAMASFFAPAHIRPTQQEILRCLTSAQAVSRETNTFVITKPVLSAAAAVYMVTNALQYGIVLHRGDITLPVTLFPKIVESVFATYVNGIAEVAASDEGGGWTDDFEAGTVTTTSLAAHLAKIANIAIRPGAPRERKRSWSHKLLPHRRIYTIAKCRTRTNSTIIPCPHQSESEQAAFCGATHTSTPADVWAKAALKVDAPVMSKIKVAARWTPPCVKSFNSVPHQNDRTRFETANIINKVAALVEHASTA